MVTQLTVAFGIFALTGVTLEDPTFAIEGVAVVSQLFTFQL